MVSPPLSLGAADVHRKHPEAEADAEGRQDERRPPAAERFDKGLATALALDSETVDLRQCEARTGLGDQRNKVAQKPNENEGAIVKVVTAVVIAVGIVVEVVFCKQDCYSEEVHTQCRRGQRHEKL